MRQRCIALLAALLLVARPRAALGQPCRGKFSPDGTVPGTCEVGAPGCKHGPQCQSRRDNAFMPLFHLLGNFTAGVGAQPIAVNDVSAVIQYKDSGTSSTRCVHILPRFHRRRQPAAADSAPDQRPRTADQRRSALALPRTFWAARLSARGQLRRYPLEEPSLPADPRNESSHYCDALGSYDGSLTLDPSVNGGAPGLLYDTMNATRTPTQPHAAPAGPAAGSAVVGAGGAR